MFGENFLVQAEQILNTIQDIKKIIAISNQRTSIKGGPYITALTYDLNSKKISGANIISDYRGVAFANYIGKCF